MSETIRVKVTIDTDELRKWADHHADRGHHGVAHVLYKAATDGESLTEQALAEARREGGAKALSEAADAWTQGAWVIAAGRRGKVGVAQALGDWLRARARVSGESR